MPCPGPGDAAILSLPHQRERDEGEDENGQQPCGDERGAVGGADEAEVQSDRRRGPAVAAPDGFPRNYPNRYPNEPPNTARIQYSSRIRRIRWRARKPLCG